MKKNAKIILSIIGLIIFIALVLGIYFAFKYWYPEYYANKGDTLSKADITSETERLKEINKYPNNNKLSSKDSKNLGIFNGLEVQEKYYCSDVCPDYGRLVIIYKDIAKEKCQEVGGRVITDAAWGGYVGCFPIEDLK